MRTIRRHTRPQQLKAGIGARSGACTSVMEALSAQGSDKQAGSRVHSNARVQDRVAQAASSAGRPQVRRRAVHVGRRSPASRFRALAAIALRIQAWQRAWCEARGACMRCRDRMSQMPDGGAQADAATPQ